MIQSIIQFVSDYYNKSVIEKDQQNVDFSYSRLANFVNSSLNFKKNVNFDKHHLNFKNFKLNLRKDLQNL